MKIITVKSELILVDMNEEELAVLTSIFECVVSKFPINYLGVPLHYETLRRRMSNPL
jgi:hypothetical protein